MKTIEWLSFFKRYNEKKLFSVEDLLQMTGARRETLHVQLSRLTRQGVVERVGRRWYANPFNVPSVDEIAMVLRFPSYVSLEQALSRHDILSQTAFAVTLVTTRLPYAFVCRGIRLEYHQISRRLFWGYVFDGRANVAHPEKAVLDLIYIRYVRNRELTHDRLRSLLDDMYLADLDRDRLLVYAGRFGGPVRGVVDDLLARL